MGLKLFDIVPEFSKTYDFTLFSKVIVPYLLSFFSQIWHQNRSPAAKNVYAKTQSYVSEKEIGTLKRKKP